MKFTASILLNSVAIASVASVASAIPLNAQGPGNRCSDCIRKDTTALNVITKASTDHYANIAHVRLDNLMREIATAKVTSGTEELPKEKALLTIAIQSKIDEVKKACTSEELVPAFKAAVAADANLDIAWFKQEGKDLEKKMAELDVKITRLVLDRIQANMNAELLSKDCTEKMTNTEIAPAPVLEAPAPIPETPFPSPETPAPAPDTPALAPASVPENTNRGLKVGLDVAVNVDPKCVCKSGCNDSQDAKNVLSLRVNLENELKPRLDHVYNQEVPTACEEKRPSLLDGALYLLY
ncbi:hypothetical protein BGZ95_009843 [Linnemannia exigua]|uniref:Uncharacterized protein n=1 Tax=Linnemannia exigua TaxID=604196 RepID=A0AAD4DCP0_9FUNG|nr:hypothetical protein BGZ95_009843 [Linnemannia exigua]